MREPAKLAAYLKELRCKRTLWTIRYWLTNTRGGGSSTAKWTFPSLFRQKQWSAEILLRFLPNFQTFLPNIHTLLRIAATRLRLECTFSALRLLKTHIRSTTKEGRTSVHKRWFGLVKTNWWGVEWVCVMSLRYRRSIVVRSLCYSKIYYVVW